VGVFVGPNADWVLPARPGAVGQLRHRVADFAVQVGAAHEEVQTIAYAVSETVSNAVIHAYCGGDGQVRVSCRVDGGRLIVEVADEGIGIAPRHDSPGIGHGLAIVGSLARTLDIGPGPDGRGTIVTMGFGPIRPREVHPGVELLCVLALDTVADVSAVDVIRDGVLRRVAAEVANDPVLTAWLRTAVPPAKPGTATWAALREGGVRLVVHDPTAQRSPGGTGERLNLTWWLAIAFATADATPAALWGFGGREGGRPVPPEKIIRVFRDAARGDLAQAAEQAMLRTHLASAQPPAEL
jgi:anti-sigma regulatory factor (Ser/Thr protein kinase)